jgi:hypothetical protein
MKIQLKQNNKIKMMKSFLRVCLHDQKYDILYLNLKKIVLDLVGPDLNGFIDLMTE